MPTVYLISLQLGHRNLRSSTEAWVNLQKQLIETMRTNKTRLSKVREIASNTEKLLRPSLEQLKGLPNDYRGRDGKNEVESAYDDAYSAMKLESQKKGRPYEPRKNDKRMWHHQYGQQERAENSRSLSEVGILSDQRVTGVVLSTGFVMPHLGWTPRRPSNDDTVVDYAEAALWAMEAGVSR